MVKVRDFNPYNLQPFEDSHLKVVRETGMVFEGDAWLFTIYLPRWVEVEDKRIEICNAKDEFLPVKLLKEDFGGCTSAPLFPKGIGLRGENFEVNYHREISVIASCWEGTLKYFKALREELETCSGENQVLVLRQNLTII
jgi:hypothetical protein